MLIDGPYGAPAQDYKKYDVVLLVGLGIGATPMISIVKDIVNNMKGMEEDEAALKDGTSSIANENPLATASSLNTSKGKSGSVSGNHFKTRKAYFYWVTREQGSFDWFKGVMNEVAETDSLKCIITALVCMKKGMRGQLLLLCFSQSTMPRMVLTLCPALGLSHTLQSPTGAMSTNASLSTIQVAE